MPVRRLPAWRHSFLAGKIFVKFIFRNITETCGKNVGLVKIGEKLNELYMETYKV
jgi:hypothetical protein